MRCIFLLLTCLLPAGLAFAQSKGTGTIKGIVVDSTTRKPLLQATVSLVSAGDSAYQTFSFTGGEGNFTFKNVAEGHYRVLVTFVGFENLSRPVAIWREKPVAGLDTLFMQPLTIALNEVVVIQERAPVALKGDTIEFNGDSFKTRPNAQVEELLKKLPGIEVSRDGTIRAQGEEVRRVLVDGKPFFGDDPKVATRNLPAEIIDKIQLYDQQSDQSAFSGFDDGNREKTINLTTKKDKRKGVFGQNGVGAGTDGRYQARLNFNRFNNEQQVSVLGLANNLNQQGFTMQDMFNFGAGGPGGGNGNALASGTGGGGPVLVTPGMGNNSGGGNPGNGTASNITETWAGGLNLRDAWGRKVDFSGSYFVNRPEVTTDQRSLRQNMLPDTTYFQDQANHSVDQSLNHRLNFRLDYKPDSLNTLRIAPDFSWQATRYNRLAQARAFTGADNPLYESSTRTTNQGAGLYGTNNLLWMRKFRKKGRTFSLNLNTVWNGQDRSGTVQSDNAFFGQDPGQTAPRTVNQRSQQQAQVLNNTVNASYTEPLSLRRTLEVHVAYGRNGNHSDRSVYDWDEGSGRYDRPNDSLSNAFDNTFTTQRGGFNVQTRRLKYTYSVGLDVQQAGLRNDDRTLATALGRRFTNLLPAAMFTYHFARNRTLRINYRTRIHAPSVSQLQPVPDNTDPLNLRLGNPDLRPEYVHNVTALYNRFEPVSFRTLFAVVNVSRTENKIVDGTNVSPVGVQTTQPLNTDGNYNLNGFLAYGGPLKGIRTNLNLTTSLNYSRGVGRVNDRENLSHNFRVGQGINLQSNWSEKVDVGLSGNVMYQKAAYSLLSGRNTAFFSQYLTLDVHYELPFRFVFTTDFTYNRTAGGAAAYNQQFALWNGGIARQLFKHKQGELKFSVYDLLNQNRSITRNVSDFYVEDVQSRVLRQYYLLSFTYHLRRFSGNAGSRPKGPSFPAVPPPPNG